MDIDWYAHPDVKKSRLRALMPHIAGVTAEVAQVTSTAKGDGNLTRGIMRYERTVRRLLDAVGLVEGLAVKCENNECIVHFGDSPPIKFCYDDPEQLRSSRTVPSPRELRETPTFFGIDANFAAVPLVAPNAVLRAFIENDELSIGLFAPGGAPLLDILAVTAGDAAAADTIDALGAERASAVEFEAVEPDVDEMDAAAADETEAI